MTTDVLRAADEDPDIRVATTKKLMRERRDTAWTGK